MARATKQTYKPTLTYQQVQKQYENANQGIYNAKRNLAAQQQDLANKQNDALANSAASAAYRAYRRQGVDNAALASNMGMTGGARERLAINNATNYNQNVNTLNAGRLQRAQDIRNTYNQTLADAASARDSANAQAALDLGQARISYDRGVYEADRDYRQRAASDAANLAEQQRQYNLTRQDNLAAERREDAALRRQEAYQRQQETYQKQQNTINQFNSTIARFNTLAKCDSAIRNLVALRNKYQKQGKDTTVVNAEIQAVQAQRAILVQYGVKK